MKGNFLNGVLYEYYMEIQIINEAKKMASFTVEIKLAIQDSFRILSDENVFSEKSLLVSLQKSPYV